MINLFFVVHDHSGARTYANELLSWLSLRKGITIHKIIFESADYKEYSVIKEENLITIHIPALKIKGDTIEKYSRRCFDLMTPIIQGKNNIIFHLNKSAQVKIGLEARKRFSAKIIYTLHYLPSYFSSFATGTSNPQKVTTIGDELEREMAAEADHIICVTQFAREMMKQHYLVPELKMTVIYNGYSSLGNCLHSSNLKENHKKQFGFRTDEQIILFVGRLQRGKGVEKLVEAFKKLINEFENLQLVLVGEGEFNELMNQCRGNFGRISFTGKLPSEQVKQLYQIADLGVIPSEFEQCSYVGLEMMYFGLPVVCSDAPGLKELFSDEESALIVSLQERADGLPALEITEQGLYKAIRRILDDKTLARKLAHTAHFIWQEHFTCDCMGQLTLTIYEEIMANH